MTDAPQGADFLSQMAEVRRRQGKAPIDPPRIEGFGGPGDPPPPAPPQREVHIPSAAELFGGPAAEPMPEPEAPVSPLVAVAQAPEPTRPVDLQITAELIVLDELAQYQDHRVKLTPQEKARLVAIIIGAAKREMSDRYAKISALLPKRRRKTKADDAPKRRGRPPKDKA
jgi:hypothetical protein